MNYSPEFEAALGVFDAVLDAMVRNREENTINVDSTNVCSEPTCSCKSNTFRANDICADIKQVIFNDPATIVTFSDGSKVCVKACEKDTFNKDVGLMYAIVKRLYANDIDENGYLVARGLGEKISNKIIATAYDQKKFEAEKLAKKAKKSENKVKEDATKVEANSAKKPSKENTSKNKKKSSK